MAKSKAREEAVSTVKSTVRDIRRSNTEVIRVSVGEFKNASYIDIRVFFEDQATGEYRPTKKGVTFKQEHLSELIEALQETSGSLVKN